MTRHDRDLVEIVAMAIVWAIVMAFFCLSSEARADDWFCTDRAVVREGDLYKSCGVASSPFENTARLNALTDAKQEFISMCDLDKDCLGHEVTVQPKRTECIKDLLGWTCRRLLVFHVLETKSRLQFHPNYEAYVRSRYVQVR